MSFLHLYTSSCFKYLAILIFVFPLAACSVSQPDALIGDNRVSGSESVSDRSDRESTSDDNAKKVLKVSWSAPLKREDESALNLVEIAEYRVYYGVRTGHYDNIIIVGGNSTFEAEDSNVAKGTYYVAVTAVDSDGLESGFSQEIIVTI